MDIGSAVSRASGVREEQMIELGRYRDSNAFTPVEKLVIELAEAMSRTPATVPQTLFDALRAHFDEAQLVELSAVIAWENYRARFNRTFDVKPDGFSEGAFCVLPETAGSPA
jgi:alkylhydroperoxidase family enzyme